MLSKKIIIAAAISAFAILQTAQAADITLLNVCLLYTSDAADE